MNLSVVLITLNAERTLDQVLKAVSFSDDIVIVDSGSTDRTREIAEKYHARFFHQDFLGFGKQKQFAVALAKYDWVLSIDADEVISDSLVNFLKSTLNYSQSSFAGYSFPFINVFLGKEMLFWGSQNMSQLRLFRKNLGNYNDLSVHEKIELKGEIKHLDYPIYHHSYENITHYFLKFNHYTTNAAKELYKNGKTITYFDMFLRVPLKFLQLYLLRGGFRLSWQGFFWSVFSSFYVFVKYSKLRELQSQDIIK
jgi:glycosyltransferase involved in cell wall biosynthesis